MKDTPEMQSLREEALQAQYVMEAARTLRTIQQQHGALLFRIAMLFPGVPLCTLEKYVLAHIRNEAQRAGRLNTRLIAALDCVCLTCWRSKRSTAKTIN